jgi:hypothetical protein
MLRSCPPPSMNGSMGLLGIDIDKTDAFGAVKFMGGAG